MRGVTVMHTPSVTTFWDRLGASAHPLAPLPLERLLIEADAPLALWEHNVNGTSRDTSPPSVSDPVRATLVASSFSAERVPTDADLGAAVENWLEESNGKLEAAVFALDERVDDLRPGHIAQLPLECVVGARSIVCEPITPPIAASHLFSAAANGGAYNCGRGAAYGRRDQWRSLAALVGTDNARPVTEIERIANGCRFFVLAIDSPWMHQVAWDLGLACVRDDRRTVAILCATDTD